MYIDILPHSSRTLVRASAELASTDSAMWTVKLVCLLIDGLLWKRPQDQTLRKTVNAQCMI